MKKVVLLLSIMLLGAFALESWVNEAYTAADDDFIVAEHNGWFYHITRRGASTSDQSGANKEIMFSYSSDSGQTWISKNVLPENAVKSMDFNQMAVFDSVLYLFVMFEYEAGGRKVLRYKSTDRGVTLQEDTTFRSLDLHMYDPIHTWKFTNADMYYSAARVPTSTSGNHSDIYLSTDNWNTARVLKLDSLPMNLDFKDRLFVYNNVMYSMTKEGVMYSLSFGSTWDTTSHVFEAPIGVLPGTNSKSVILLDKVTEIGEELLKTYEYNFSNNSITLLSSTSLPYEFPTLITTPFITGDTVYVRNNEDVPWRPVCHASYDGGKSWDPMPSTQPVSDIAKDGDVIYGYVEDNPQNTVQQFHFYAKEPWRNSPKPDSVVITKGVSSGYGYWQIFMRYEEMTPTADSMQFQVSEDSTFTSTIIDTSDDYSYYSAAYTIGYNTLNWSVTEGKKYYFRARSYKRNGVYTDWSEISSAWAGDSTKSTNILTGETVKNAQRFSITNAQLRLPSQSPFSVKIFTANGKIVREIRGSTNLINMNNLGLASGVYQMRVVQGADVFTSKFVLK